MVYAEFGGQTECIMGNWKIENYCYGLNSFSGGRGERQLTLIWHGGIFRIRVHGISQKNNLYFFAK